jgi:hypothetical protein
VAEDVVGAQTGQQHGVVRPESQPGHVARLEHLTEGPHPGSTNWAGRKPLEVHANEGRKPGSGAQH